MFYKFEKGLTAGYVDKSDLSELAKKYGFAESTVLACQNKAGKYRSVVEKHDKYTFGILHIVGNLKDEDDWVAIYITKKLFLVVDLYDKDGSTEKIFAAAMNRLSSKKVNIAKIFLAFFEGMTLDDVQIIEEIGIQITELEDSLLSKDADKDFNLTALQTKKYVQRLHYYYEHILDLIEVIYENDNDIIDYEDMIHISNLMHRIERLNEDATSINASLEHLQDAYFSYQDVKMNKTMKILTVLSTIFFPLTIIVGWYGMNFMSMPEFAWRYGYAYVIILSAVVMIALLIIAKKGKWFK